MNIKNKKILITGAGGFIGSHLTERLVTEGHKVSVFLRYNSRQNKGMLEELPNEIQNQINIFWGDLKDADSIRKAIKNHQVVFHLAALIGIPYSYVNPIDVIGTNVMGTSYVLNACHEFGIEKLIHTSTSETYGTAQFTPITEQHPALGQSPYSATKIGADKIAESYFRAFDLPVAVLRPFNTFGPRQSLRAVIPTIITQALTQPVIKLGSLAPTRDLTFVLDTVNGFIRCAESDKTVGEEINIGTGKEVSIGDLAKKILDILKIKKEIIIDQQRIRPEKSEVYQLVCDFQKAKKLMNWTPQYNLEQGLSITIDWIKNNINKYKPDTYAY